MKIELERYDLCGVLDAAGKKKPSVIVQFLVVYFAPPAVER